MNNFTNREGGVNPPADGSCPAWHDMHVDVDPVARRVSSPCKGYLLAVPEGRLEPSMP